MKLIFCPVCLDVIKLTVGKVRECECGTSYGRYEDDGYNAKIGGKAIPVGIDNVSFVQALQERPKEGLGSVFNAFVIPEKCPTIKNF